ncbi:MAG: hypothetical protein IT229_04650 [Flavobacteriales bacterium]|nr:hypothetical protein [Flavobacteriales bacterium]
MRAPSFALEETYPLSRLLFTDRELEALRPRQVVPPNTVGQQVSQMLHEEGGDRLPYLSQVSLAEMGTYMQNVLLRDTDQMSMAHALEVRVPFLDHDLVEFVLGVNDEQKFPHSPKQLLVESLGELLPSSIVNRPKMGFTLPWAAWMRSELRSYCSSRLEALGRKESFDARAIDALWNRFLGGDKLVPWGRVWHLVVLSDWLDRHSIED